MLRERSFDGAYSPGTIREVAGARCELLTIDTNEGARSVLHHADHALIAMVGGPASLVTVKADGAPDFSGVKRPGSAGFFPAGRRVESGWPAMRLSYLLALTPHAVVEEAVGRTLAGDAWHAEPDLDDPFAQAALRELASLMERADSPVDLLLADSIVTALQLRMVQRRSDYAIEGRAASEPIRAVLDHVEGNLAARLTLADLCAVARLPRARLVEAFRSATGLTPHRYVVERRLARARLLLVTTPLQVPEVAALVGCASGSHLTALLQQHHGTTPRAIRHAAGARSDVRKD